jgi:alanyl-tRNA synthetase
MNKSLTGAQIRQSFIDFFVEKGHTFVPSSSLVPGGDQTLLFTNAGMVQFKEVFLGTDRRPYSRAVNSQKCMRVAGKHNDLEDVGQDDTHHTFFEMLGNWSFGDYYKKEAISWAWELLTKIWGLPKEVLWASCFKDEKGEIPSDDEATHWWQQQAGINPAHVVYFGRKENFWEMADTGPCGPCSEIHIDRGEEYCDKRFEPGHVCRVNGDCKRFLELWNLVFIQYNRLSPGQLEPLPSRHVDTGMGLERIVSVIQEVKSNYATDLLSPMLDEIQKITGQSLEERQTNVTPYRVIADHARAATFLIADGVVPGNTGRNYICRMIIRRAARFGSKIGLDQPFLAKISSSVIENYNSAYPELSRYKTSILENITREEERFQRTVEAGITRLNELLAGKKELGERCLEGHQAFDLYATLGLPLELTRDVAREQGMDVDEDGFRSAMEEHRVASGAGKVFGVMGGKDAENYHQIFLDLVANDKIDAAGVEYNPYDNLQFSSQVIELLKNGNVVESANPGDEVEIILPATCFYIESGGQVADQGKIESIANPAWEVVVSEVRRPSAGMIVHVGKVIYGEPKNYDSVLATVDAERRRDIIRNHTATHLLHAVLHKVLGEHALQAGSLVAPDHLRFDFNHPEALKSGELEEIEADVNRAIYRNYPLVTLNESLKQAISEGATALFGEKYGENVRTVKIGRENLFSFELCGGTHVHETGEIGIFLITAEGSAAAGVRRIEAVTGQFAYKLAQHRSKLLKKSAAILETSLEDVPIKIENLISDYETLRKQITALRQESVAVDFQSKLKNVVEISGISVLTAILPNAESDTLRQMTDQFKNIYTSGSVVLGSVVDNKPVVVAAITDDLIKRGFHAGELVKLVAQPLGGSGGGKPNLAQAGGKDASRLSEALDQVIPWVKQKIK